MPEEPRTYRCVRCGEAKARVQRVRFGPHAGVLICEACVARLIAIAEGADAPRDKPRQERTPDA